MKPKSRVSDIKTIAALLTGAEDEARASGVAEPGAEHLLLSAFDLPDGTARHAFERVGADPEAFRDAIAAVHEEALRAIGVEGNAGGPSGLPAPPAQGVYRMTASGKAAFDAAGAMARGDRGVGLIGAHVVLAVARMDEGSAVRALDHMGIARDELGAAAQAEIDLHRGR